MRTDLIPRTRGRRAARAVAWVAGLLTLGAGSALSSGCGTSASEVEAAAPAVEDLRVPLKVTNRHWRDVEVFLLLGGAKRRLGRVGAMANADLTVPAPSAVCQVRLVVRAAGQPSLFTSPPANLRPGTSLDLLVPSDPAGLVLTAW